MRIKRLSWTNYKGLGDGAIDADGSDVIVRGQNGCGKSTIAEMVSFILFGLERGKTIKPYEGGRVQHSGESVHGAQVTFDDGTSLCRKVGGRGKNEYRYFVNGQSATAGAFNVEVNRITNGGGELVFNPFHFHEMPWQEQRKLLVGIIGDVKESDVATPEEITLLNGRTADEFIDAAKDKRQNLKLRANRCPAAIDELSRRLEKTPVDYSEEIKQIESQIARVEADISELETARDNLNQSAATNAKTEYESLMRQADALKSTIARNERERDRKENQRQKLGEQWRTVRDSKPGICPTCEQKIPHAKFYAAQKEKLNAIKAEGQAIKAEIESLNELIAADSQTLFELGVRTGMLSQAAEAQSADENKRLSQLAEVKRTIADKRKALNDLRTALAERKAATKADADNRAEDAKRIADVQAELKNLNEKIAKIEGNINAAKLIRQRVVDSLEEKINSHFGAVKFKLFNIIASTGEAKETCEAFMHEVPYSALSKGEKLKCALETFKIIQEHFGAEMPIIIDNAESYTLNSFVDMPNQKWLFKVSDDKELVIEMIEGAKS